MKFWELREPAGSDYKHVHTSGRLDHPFRMPTVKCEQCGEIVVNFDAVLPLECPVPFRTNKLLTDHATEIPMGQFKKLVFDMSAELRGTAVKKASLVPGACFQPGYLDVPSTPRSDFLWSDSWTGLHTVVVSQRIKDILESEAGSQVVLYPVVPRRIGKRSAKSAPRIPKSGEPEDSLLGYRTAANPHAVGPYYHLRVLAETAYPPGTEPKPGPACRVCGEEMKFDSARWRAQQAAWKALTPESLASIWKGSHIFRLPDRETILITDQLKIKIERLKATCVSFREFPSPPQNLPRERNH